MAKQRVTRWSNWSGSVQSTPRQVATPGSLAELTALVKSCAGNGHTIRVVGTGHSFTPLVQTDDVLVSLDRLQGIVAENPERHTVTVWGGTKLKVLGEELFARGVAQENLGDIDVQSIAGAISTGTHGTGITFGTLATQVAGLMLVTASGDILECSPEQHPEIFKAAQVSLGTLGIIAQVTLRVVPTKRLHYRSQRMQLSATLAHLEEFKQANAHFEFYWFPYTEACQVKFMNETALPVSKSSLWGTFNKVVLENDVFWVLSEACRRMPGLCERVSAISGSAVPNVDEVNYSHRQFATPRAVRFQEMEYNIPAAEFAATLTEIKDCITHQRFRVHFPVECRFVRRDDIWLSPAFERDSAYIAVHMYRGMPYQDYFTQIEAILQRHQGRPHWGKMHTCTAAELAELYPRWKDFCRVRAQLDPHGTFLNSYLCALFAVESDKPPAIRGQATENS